MCAGGPVTCHPGRTKRRREKAAYKYREEAAAAAAGAVGGAAPADPHGVGGHLPLLLSFSPGGVAAPGQGGGAAAGLAPAGHPLGAFPPFPMAATSGADLTQAIQVMAARALISCVPEALSGANPTIVVTAANAAAAAFSVTLMSLMAQPGAVHAPPPAHVLDPRYYDMHQFRQLGVLGGLGAGAAAAPGGQGLSTAGWMMPQGGRAQGGAGGAATPPGQTGQGHGGAEAPRGGGAR